MTTIKPISPKEHFIQQVADCEGWFKDHVATIIGEITSEKQPLIAISFRNPTSWVYGMRIIVHSQWICIMGDIGECIHQWSESITLDFLAACNFHYYNGKCQASDDFKRSNATWDSGVAMHFLIDEKEALDSSTCEIFQDIEDSGNYTREEFEGAAHAIYNLTGDGELAGAFSKAGEVPSAQAIGRWVGLRKAIQQLKQQPPI